ncbi:hypothetical protein C8E86_5513 [Catellatospora citrea]|nr:hypothetical protein C8E86_5513 [Catellatospora citrea]
MPSDLPEPQSADTSTPADAPPEPAPPVAPPVPENLPQSTASSDPAGDGPSSIADALATTDEAKVAAANKALADDRRDTYEFHTTKQHKTAQAVRAGALTDGILDPIKSIKSVVDMVWPTKGAAADGKQASKSESAPPAKVLEPESVPEKKEPVPSQRTTAERTPDEPEADNGPKAEPRPSAEDPAPLSVNSGEPTTGDAKE